MKDHSLSDGCYKQLKKCSQAVSNKKQKKRMTGQLAVLGAIVSYYLVTICFLLKAGKIIIIINK